MAGIQHQNFQSARSEINTNTYTLAGYAVPSGSNRVLVVELEVLRSNTNEINPTGVTFDGGALTEIVSSKDTSTSRSYYAGTWILVNAPVTTGDIVASIGANMAGCIITAVTLTNVDQTTPTPHVGSGTTTASTFGFGTGSTADLTGTPGDYYLYAVTGNANLAPTWTWSGTAIELYDSSPSSSNNEVAGSVAYSRVQPTAPGGAMVIATCSQSLPRIVGVVVGFKSAAPPPDETLLDDLVAWWPLNESSGTRNDAAGGHHLTDVGSVGSTTGKVGNAAVMGSSARWLELADSSDFDVSDGFTVAGWFYANASPVGDVLVSVWNEDGVDERGWRVYFSGDTTLRLYQSSLGTSATVMSTPDVSAGATGVWRWFCAWHDSETNQIHLMIGGGGVQYAIGGAFQSPAKLMLGAEETSSGAWRYLNGNLDEVAYWKRALTNSERAWLYNAGAGRAYTDLDVPASGQPPRSMHQFAQRRVRR